jgi:UDP-glucose 4-epimerase
MSLKDVKILVTGGAGFIGSHLVEGLVTRGANVVVLDNLSNGNMDNLKKVSSKIQVIEGDIRDEVCVVEACKGCKAIFHEAAVGLKRCEKYPKESVDINIHGTLNIIKGALANNSKLIFASSASVYGNPVYVPMDENHPLNPITPYCVSKVSCEHLIRSFARKGLQYVILRYFNVYGPRQPITAYYTSVIINFVKNLIREKPSTIFGDGTQSLDFVYVKDVVQANLLALEKKEMVNDVFNVGSGIETTINELYHLLAKICKKDIKPNYIPQTSHPIVKRRLADITKISKYGFKISVPLEIGLKETVEYVKSSWDLNESSSN